MSIKEIVDNTLSTLNSGLKQLIEDSIRQERSKDDLKAEVKLFIDKTISDAFHTIENEAKQEFNAQEHAEQSQKDVINAARTTLYKKLAIELHSDKLTKRNIELTDTLTKLDMMDEPFQKVNNHYKPTNIVQDIMSNPKDAFEKWRTRFHDILFADSRYIQPFKAFAKIANWTINILLILATLLALVFFGLVELTLRAVSSLQRRVVNWLTNDLYDKEESDFFNDTDLFAKAKSEYINNARNKENLSKYCDDDIIDMIVRNKREFDKGLTEEQAQALVNDEIKALMRGPTEVISVQWVAKALYKAVISPIPEGIFNKLFSVVIVKPVQTISMFVLIPFAALPKLTVYLGRGLAIAGIVIAIAIKAVSLLIIHAPILLLDAGRAIINKMSSRQTVEREPSEQPASRGTNPLLLLGGQSQAVAPSSDLKQPYQGHGLFNAASSVTTSVNDRVLLNS